MTAQPIIGLDLADLVARRVRGLLGEHRMTQADLSRVLGISQASMSDRLRGVKDFDLNELPALAGTLQVSVEYLLGLTDERSPRQTMSDEGFGTLRARRDSNPKPSDLESEGGRVIDLASWREKRNAGSRGTAVVPANGRAS